MWDLRWGSLSRVGFGFGVAYAKPRWLNQWASNVLKGESKPDGEENVNVYSTGMLCLAKSLSPGLSLPS